MKNIFITGITGFLGAHLARELIKQNKNVIGLEHDNKKSHIDDLNIRDKLTLVQGDLQTVDFERVLIEYDIDSVFHLAAVAIVQTANKLPSYTFNTNIVGTTRLLDACIGKNLEVIMVASTDKVYGNKLNASETDNLVASGIYETSKTCTDLVTQMYTDKFNLPICITRCCNLVGLDRNSRIFPNVIRQCIAGERPTIFENVLGVREYIHVSDAVSAYISLAENINITAGQAYNIGTGEIATQSEIVNMIANEFNLKPKIKQASSVQAGELIEQSLNSNKIRRDISWNNKFNLQKIVIKTIEEFKVR